MEHYGHGDIMIEEGEDRLIQQNIHHQFKYLVLHGVNLVVVVVLLEQSKLMEHYGHGEVVILVK